MAYLEATQSLIGEVFSDSGLGEVTMVRQLLGFVFGNFMQGVGLSWSDTMYVVIRDLAYEFRKLT